VHHTVTDTGKLKEWAKREAKAQGQRSLNSWINAMLEQRRADQANA